MKLLKQWKYLWTVRIREKDCETNDIETWAPNVSCLEIKTRKGYKPPQNSTQQKSPANRISNQEIEICHSLYPDVWEDDALLGSLFANRYHLILSEGKESQRISQWPHFKRLIFFSINFWEGSNIITNVLQLLKTLSGTLITFRNFSNSSGSVFLASEWKISENKISCYKSYKIRGCFQGSSNRNNFQKLLGCFNLIFFLIT